MQIVGRSVIHERQTDRLRPFVILHEKDEKCCESVPPPPPHPPQSPRDSWGGSGGGGVGWGGGSAGGRIMRTTQSLLKRLFHFHVTRWVARSEPGVSRLWSFCGHCGRSPHETPDNRLDALHTTAS